MIEGPPIQPKKLEKNRVLLVEGRDDEIFFKAMLSYLKIADWQVWNCGGKDNIADAIMRISKDPLRPDLKTLLVTRDADETPLSAFESVRHALERYGFTFPKSKNTFTDGVPKVGVFLLAGSSGLGMLEDCCLQSVHNDPAMSCVNAFSTCTATLPNPPRNISKSRAQAYLAAREEYVKDIGTAAQKGYWNFEAETLRELREFLLKLYAE